MPRPGLVLDVDRSTPPILFHHGEGFRLEKLPPGRSRVVYPAEPLEPLKDVTAAIDHALDHPLDSDPLSARLFPGMKLVIAFDDVSLPLPKMRRPDIRQRVIEAVLDRAAAAGVDDVRIIAGTPADIAPEDAADAADTDESSSMPTTTPATTRGTT